VGLSDQQWIRSWHLLVAGHLDPAFGARFRAEFLDHRRAALATIVERTRWQDR
jgi:hypothetical protein